MKRYGVSLVFCAALCLAAPSAHAQTVPPLQDWGRVQNVATATNLHVNTASSQVYCQLKAVDADSLTCVHSFKVIEFKRSESGLAFGLFDFWPRTLYRA